MIEGPKTAFDLFMMDVEACSRTLQLEEVAAEADFTITMAYSVRRCAFAISCMRELHAHLHGNGPKPRMMPSKAFNPSMGPDATNIYYLFMFVRSMAPWDLPKKQLVKPMAMYLRMIEVAQELFPGREVSEFAITWQSFMSRWVRPKLHPEWTEQEREAELVQYRKDIDTLEEDVKAAYKNLSTMFERIEKPESDPLARDIAETCKNIRKIVARICPKEASPSFVAQQWAYERWLDFRNNPVAKSKYCVRHHRLSHADCFDFHKRQALEHGFKNAKQLDKAIEAAMKRNRRTV